MPDTANLSPTDWPLFCRFPSLAAKRGGRVHRVLLGEWPTPVERLDTGALKGSASLWIKRDDLTGRRYGGNKVRKLELLLGDAKARGASSVWTVGAIGSNHCLATTLYASSLGLGVRVLHFPQPVTEHVRRNIRAISSAGAQLSLASRVALPVEMGRRRLGDWLARKSEDDVYIPGGGSSALGALSFVNAAFELADQIAAGECPEPDQIYVAAGTCGTFVGLWLGCALAGLKTEVVGVRVVDRLVCNKPLIRSLAGKVLDLFAPNDVDRRALLKRPIILDHEQFGEEYGRPTDAARSAMELAKSAGTPTLEFTYTGKAFAGMLKGAQAVDGARTIFYWHTLSSSDISDLVEATPPEALPQEYGRFFDGPVEIAE